MGLSSCGHQGDITLCSWCMWCSITLTWFNLPLFISYSFIRSLGWTGNLSHVTIIVRIGVWVISLIARAGSHFSPFIFQYFCANNFYQLDGFAQRRRGAMWYWALSIRKEANHINVAAIQFSFSHHSIAHHFIAQAILYHLITNMINQPDLIPSYISRSCWQCLILSRLTDHLSFHPSNILLTILQTWSRTDQVASCQACCPSITNNVTSYINQSSILTSTRSITSSRTKEQDSDIWLILCVEIAVLSMKLNDRTSLSLNFLLFTDRCNRRILMFIY